jgi:hypothetical protein
MDFPRAKAGLLSHELDKQVVVYDPDGDRVHLLDAPTGQLLKAIQGDSAETSKVSDVFEAAGELKDDMYKVALDELTRADLIENAPAPLPDVTRRELFRKIAVIGAGALLVPAVVSMTPGSLLAQSACDTRINNGNSMCVTNNPPCCAPLVCKNDNMCYIATGDACTTNQQCFTGMCDTTVTHTCVP